MEKSGFKTIELNDVVVAVGTTAVLHPQLAVGSVEVQKPFFFRTIYRAKAKDLAQQGFLRC